jgi:hypothetical protein
MYIMIMIQCHAYYMPKDIYHLIYLVQCKLRLYLLLSSTPLNSCPFEWDYHKLFIAFKLNSTPTNVAAYSSVLDLPVRSRQSHSFYLLMIGEQRFEMEESLTLAGKALAIAGPKPFQSAVTPSAAINFRAQSRKPEYVP